MMALLTFAGLGDMGKNMVTTQGGWAFRQELGQGIEHPQWSSRVNVVNDRSIPTKSSPNSVIRQVDSRGRPILERHFGPDGLAVRDIHFSNHGNSATHPHVPHRHYWDWSNPDKPVPGPTLPG